MKISFNRSRGGLDDSPGEADQKGLSNYVLEISFGGITHLGIFANLLSTYSAPLSRRPT